MSDTNAEDERHPNNCVCFDGDYCELQIDAYEELAALVAATQSDGVDPAGTMDA